MSVPAASEQSGRQQTAPKQSASGSPLYRTERVIASLTVAWVVILTTYMIFENHALSYTSIYFLKIVLSLSGGVMLATLPGFFDINYTLGGFSVRAAGGAAAFVFIYTQSPNLPALKADEAIAPPGYEQPADPAPPTPERLSQADNLPVTMAFILSPASFVPPQAQPGYNGSEGSQSGTTSDNAPVNASGRVSIAEAVSTDFHGLASGAQTLFRSAFMQFKAWLDLAARQLRATVDTIIDTLRQVLGLKQGMGDRAPIIGVLSEDLDTTLEDLGAGFPDKSDLSLSDVLFDIGTLGSSTLDGLSRSVDALVGTTDRTVGVVLNGVQQTSGQLLLKTDKVVTGVTGTLDRASGGLTENVTTPVEKLSGGVTRSAGAVTEKAVSQSDETASDVLVRINAGVQKVTDSLNAVSPKLVSILGENEGAAGDSAGQAEKKARTAPQLPASAASVVDGELPGADFQDDANPPGAAAVSNMLGRGRAALGKAGSAVCVSGCGSPSRGAGRGAVRGLVSGARGGLSGAAGTGAMAGGGSGGAVGGVGGASGGGSHGGGSSAGGLVSSTVQTTGSVVGGAVKSLGSKKK